MGRARFSGAASRSEKSPALATAGALAVPAHELLSRGSLRPPEGLWQPSQQIGRDHGMLAQALTHDISGESVQMNCGNHGQQRILRALRDHACNDAGENIARAPG